MSDSLLHYTTITLSLIALAAVAVLSACAGVPPVDSERAADAADEQRPPGWREESHSSDVDPNYGVVFPADAVNTMTITIAPDDWAAMQADMERLHAQSLPVREAVLAAGGASLSEEERMVIMAQVFAAQASTDAEAAPAGEEEDAAQKSPMWVPAAITFQDQEWTHVGVRYKGVSSLNNPWMMGESRLPFKFNFDHFEDDYPEIKNQRFFGFQELSLSNNYEDPAGMRDTIVYDLLEEAGLPSLQTAPYEVMLDYGEGPAPLGLYTLVELIDDTGVPAYFGSSDGNIYEGDGPGASLSTEHAGEIVTGFDKKNNEDETDWSDIQALYDVLHDERRSSDPAAWRADLEAVFDVEAFLEWLGISAIVGNGDSYGASPHNFYLYHDPQTGRLTWYSWDHNFTFMSSLLSVVTLDKPSDKEGAPLIGYLLDDPVYFTRYKELLAENFAGVAAPEAVLAKIATYANLIAPAAARQMSPADYDTAVQEMVDFVEARGPIIEEFLARQ